MALLVGQLDLVGEHHHALSVPTQGARTMNARTHYRQADRAARRTARRAHRGPTETLAHREWQAALIAHRYNTNGGRLRGPRGT